MSIASAIGTTVESILINCSHTHCGPNTWEFSWESDDQHRLQRAYLENLKHLLTGCAVAADRQLRPARIGTGNGSSHIGINRRELDESGKIFLGRIRTVRWIPLWASFALTTRAEGQWPCSSATAVHR